MFWKKRKVEKLPRLKDIPEPVGRYLVVHMAQNLAWVYKLKCVVHPRPESKYAFDFRVFGEAQAAARSVTVKDYNSLDEHPDLILYQGQFDKKSGTVQIGTQPVKVTFVCGNCGHEWEQECPEEALTGTSRYRETCPVCSCYAGRPRRQGVEGTTNRG